ncbi:hypothetical protein CAAN1_10S00540 [[Candida] anglica]|uniref:Glycoside hydrolase family 3 N-terminal domain-containing protein n=1 Tax=[Candida] anglica TaxID=148631 RepID=A0ABP0EIJ9_9ASCO
MYVGQLLCAGFQGTSVTPQAYNLIVQQHVSTLILSKKNFSSVKQITKLIRDLQYIAMTQGNYEYPLIFAVDEEGGMMNSLFDPEYLTQFPGAMAMAATGDLDLVFQVSRALAKELKLIGFSMLLGPVLDVVTKLSHQLVGVRSFGTTPEDVVKFGRVCCKGLQQGGIFTMGKHFPGIGNASVDSLLELPMMADSLDQMRLQNTVPFRELIKEGLLDGVSAAGCAVPSISPDEVHACLSPILITELLRKELNFNGVVVSECLEMDALFHSIGLGQGVILALYAGCDLVMVCHNMTLQKEAIESMDKALANGNLDLELVNGCLGRINKLQKRLPTWAEMFPEGEKSARDDLILFKDKYHDVWEHHQQLSALAYKKSVTLVRDYKDSFPITKFLSLDDTKPDMNNVLILSPLLNPLYKHGEEDGPQKDGLYTGEDVFQKFGELLANHPFNSSPAMKGKSYNVLHTTYTANGLTALHESLIENSQVVIVLTSEASRNMYQIGIVKYVSILCGANPYSFSNKGGNRNSSQLTKPLIIVATSSPYDFFYNKSIGSAYLCCYDYTDNVLEQLSGVLMGDIQAEGCIPGEKKFVGRPKKRKLSGGNLIPSSGLTNSSSSSKKVYKRNPTPSRRWLVDELDLQRDWYALTKLWMSSTTEPTTSKEISYQDPYFYKMLYLLLRTTSNNQKHFVVRNASLNIIYGVVITWIVEEQKVSNSSIKNETKDNVSAEKVGSVLYLLVDKSKRLQSIGKNLHARAMRYLIEEKKCTKLTLGGSFPLISLSNTSQLILERNSKVISFLNNVGWDLPEKGLHKKHIMVLDNLSTWSVPKKIFRELTIVGVRFDICSNPDKLMKLIEGSDTNKSGPDASGNSTKEESSRDEENNASGTSNQPQSSGSNSDETNYTKALYMEAIKYLNNNSSNGVKIIIALEPTNQNVIGSVILFNNICPLAKFFPFINQAASVGNVSTEDPNPVIGGIIGPIIDPSYSNLTEIFKFGLVCSGITFLKSSNVEGQPKMNKCVMIGIEEDKSSNINGIKDIGFQEWKQYYDYYEKKADARTLLEN